MTSFLGTFLGSKQSKYNVFSLICLVFLGDLLGCFIWGMNAIYLLATKPHACHLFLPFCFRYRVDIKCTHVDMNAGAVA